MENGLKGRFLGYDTLYKIAYVLKEVIKDEFKKARVWRETPSILSLRSSLIHLSFFYCTVSVVNPLENTL